jgi:hypothetical protein
LHRICWDYNYATGFVEKPFSVALPEDGTTLTLIGRMAILRIKVRVPRQNKRSGRHIAYVLVTLM